MKQLDVFMDGAQIGVLREQDDGLLIFAYEKTYLARAKATPLAPEFPLRQPSYSGTEVLAFFDNLLPEGSVRNFIARAEHISPENVFGLLERFGGDTAGALSLLPQGQVPSGEPRYLPVSLDQIRAWFATSRGIPLRLAGEQARMSLSGAQDKMTVFIGADGGLSIPLGCAPSSHILKPSMGQPIPQTAVNEALVMTLAKSVGLDVPDVQFLSELDAVLIPRYDRKTGKDGSLQRLHQYDLCQVMGVPAERKYESEGGPSFQACVAAIMQQSEQPALDKKRMIEWLVFNLAVGNMDSHAKNLSLLVVDGHRRLAPFYDLLCTTVYPHLSRKFAFKVGGENRPRWIKDRHWERMANAIEVQTSMLRQTRLGMIERIQAALPAVCDGLRKTVPHAEGLMMIDHIEAEIRAGANRGVSRS